MDAEVSFGLWLRQRRKALDLTQEDLAQCVGCSVSLIRKIEADERRPSRQIAGLLADCLSVASEDRADFVKAARGERRVGQLTPLASTPDSASWRRSHRLASNLPTPSTLLIGRQHELAAIVRLLNSPQCRLLTLIGPVGIGKTRLAIEAATPQREAFADGAYFVSLASVNSATFAVPTIAEAVGFVFHDPEDPKVQLLNYLREKHMLLFLDDFEHLLVEGSPQGTGAMLLTDILQHAPGVKLLVTSRERLNLQEEWLLEIDGLPFPEDEAHRVAEVDPATVAQFPAVALFVDSACRVRPGFTLTAQNQAEVIRICQLVEGMPLAIKLAAAWVRVLSCREIAQEIERNLGFLATSARDVPERHRSLRAAFDHSWNLLSEDEQQGMRQLSVFRGSFRREAAEQVADATLPLLSALVDKSLLRRNAVGRYEMHDLIRQYATAHLVVDPEEHTATYDRYSTYCLTRLQQQEEALRTGSRTEALKELGMEIDNLRLAWDWAATHQSVGDIRKAGRGLFWLYEAHGWLQEGEAVFQQAVEALQGAVKPGEDQAVEYAIALGQALTYQAVFCYRCKQYGRARDLLEQSLALLRPHDDPLALSEALIHLAYVLYGTGVYTEARQVIEESLAISRPIGHPWAVASCLTVLGGIAHAQGEYQEAKDWFGEGLAVWRELGAPRGTAFCLTLFSTTVYALGDYGEARRLLRESLEISRTLGDRWGIGTTLNALGVLAQAQGDHSEAESLFWESLALFRELGDRLGIAQTFNHLGEAASALGTEPEAWSSFLEALKIATETHTVPVALDALAGLSTLLAREGATEPALELLMHVVQHPASSQEAKDRAEQLRAELEAQLSAQGIEAARARAGPRTFGAVVEELLGMEIL